MKARKITVIAATFAVVFLAKFALNGSDRAMPKDGAPGVMTSFETPDGRSLRASLGIRGDWHGMHQLPFGGFSKTEAITFMLSQEAVAFGVSIAVNEYEELIASTVILPDATCSSGLVNEEASELVLGNGKTVNMRTSCHRTEKGYSRDYMLSDYRSREVFMDYLENESMPIIHYPEHGPIQFNAQGFDLAVTAAKAGPRIVLNESYASAR